MAIAPPVDAESSSNSFIIELCANVDPVIKVFSPEIKSSATPSVCETPFSNVLSIIIRVSYLSAIIQLSV